MNEQIQYLKQTQTELKQNTLFLENNEIQNISSLNPCDILKQQGSVISQSIESLNLLFLDFQSFSNEQVYQCIEYISLDIQQKQEDLQKANWNISNIIKLIIQKVSSINWGKVLLQMDCQNLQIETYQQFCTFFNIFLQINKQYFFSMPQQLFNQKWQNSKSQLQFFKNLLQLNQPSIVRWDEIPKTIINLDFNPLYKYQTLNPPVLQFWACVDILQQILQLSEEYYDETKLLLEYPLKKCTDILTVGLSQIKNIKNQGLQNEILSQLFQNYLSNHSSSVQILEAIWKKNEDLLINAMCELYKNDNKKENTCLNISRILDISQQIKDSLISLTNCKDYYFSVSLGILAGKREFLHFDQWINERIKNVGNPFVEALLTYIDDNLLSQINQINSKTYFINNLQELYESALEKAQITPEILTIIFECLLTEPPYNLSEINRQKLQEQYKIIIECFPQLNGRINPQIQQIEKKANTQFQQLYSKEISIEQFIDNLNNLRKSNIKEDNEVFACMITGLLEECRFHDQYPYSELIFTGQLFGAIINAQLIFQKPLAIFLEIVLDYCKRNNKKIEFSIKAIDGMNDRLYEFPNFIYGLFDSQILLFYPDFLLKIVENCYKKGIIFNNDIQYLDQIKDKCLNQININKMQNIENNQKFYSRKFGLIDILRFLK
ncbi:transcriptional protein, putative [Ichthyophthirius multifiliis]|uniref:Transcriptional protein, putative n=1 Tax=Ichthyophthirius multifiliis TaxID=5932 RepID=G0R1C2_ICHMU|nr:transcriptional protein, putative [Ichthyophthirius multifiliis]EGR28755.1 transcriptional protein, putative [Ichthyophthirius multifiliis]|eukprot:XP_004029991.1 transcriptional protein, putative [Ichthyophthirius multifiliis]